MTDQYVTKHAWKEMDLVWPPTVGDEVDVEIDVVSGIYEVVDVVDNLATLRHIRHPVLGSPIEWEEERYTKAAMRWFSDAANILDAGRIGKIRLKAAEIARERGAQVVGRNHLAAAGLIVEATEPPTWQPHKGDQVEWENDHYVIHAIKGDIATIHDPMDDATEEVAVSELTLDLAYDDFSGLYPYG